MKPSARYSVIGGIAVAALALTSCAGLEDLLGEEYTNDQDQEVIQETSSAHDQEPFGEEVDPDELSEMLTGLEVEDLDRDEYEERSLTYNRDDYPHWERPLEEYGWPEDTNQNCNVRWATLWRDGTDLEWYDYDTCMMDDVGYWEDDYGVIDHDTGEMKDYLVTEDPSDIDIDHIVALRDGHVSGMHETEPGGDDREHFANDPDNLVISDASANRSKGDQSPETYLPPGEYRCEYVQQYIIVSDRYDLSVSTGDVERMEETIEECS